MNPRLTSLRWHFHSQEEKTSHRLCIILVGVLRLNGCNERMQIRRSEDPGEALDFHKWFPEKFLQRKTASEWRGCLAVRGSAFLFLRLGCQCSVSLLSQAGLSLLEARSRLQRQRQEPERPHNYCCGQRQRWHCHFVSIRDQKNLWCDHVDQRTTASSLTDPLHFRLRIAKMNKEMREMDGAFGQSGHSGGQGSGGSLGGTGGGLAHTRKSLQAIKNHISGWALGGQND